MVANLSTRIDNVEKVQERVEPVLSGVVTNTALILDRMERPKQFRMGLREWINSLSALAAVIVAMIALLSKTGG